VYQELYDSVVRIPCNCIAETEWKGVDHGRKSGRNLFDIRIIRNFGLLADEYTETNPQTLLTERSA
jgi:hypothetical protein